jgi:hypothetical protein
MNQISQSESPISFVPVLLLNSPIDRIRNGEESHHAHRCPRPTFLNINVGYLPPQTFILQALTLPSVRFIDLLPHRLSAERQIYCLRFERKKPAGAITADFIDVDLPSDRRP